MTLPEPSSGLKPPSSLRLLVSTGMRTHTLVFLFALLFMFTIGFIGGMTGSSIAWPIVFSTGAGVAGAYAIFALLSLSGRFRNLLLFSNPRSRVFLVAVGSSPILAATAYWISKAGSVEALPIFPVFLAVFYGWILLQAYFIAIPVSHTLVKVEARLSREGHIRKLSTTLGMASIFLPVAPLVFGVYAISNWISSSNQGSNSSIVLWAGSVTTLIFLTLFLVASWGWKAIRLGRPQAAVFAGGTFAALWLYLLYRATALMLSLLSDNRPPSTLVDITLMIVSILGAMQTFARKTIGKAGERWRNVFPFLVFSFGSMYGVAQIYYVTQFAITRAELSALVNVIVLACGILTMLVLIRIHLSAPEPSPSATYSGPTPLTATALAGTKNSSSILSRFRLRFRQPRTQSVEKLDDDGNEAIR